MGMKKIKTLEVVMKDIVRNIMMALTCVAFAVSPVIAAAAPAKEGGSLLLTLFIGFFALIVVFQLVPACLLFVGILKGLFTRKHDIKAETSNR
jgi:hypothetical protein